jgi:hypothetical protein
MGLLAAQAGVAYETVRVRDSNPLPVGATMPRTVFTF